MEGGWWFVKLQLAGLAAIVFGGGILLGWLIFH